MEEPRSTDRRAAEGRRTALGEPGTRPDTNGEGPRRRRLRLVARGTPANGNARGRGRLSRALGCRGVVGRRRIGRWLARRGLTGRRLARERPGGGGASDARSARGGVT